MRGVGMRALATLIALALPGSAMPAEPPPACPTLQHAESTEAPLVLRPGLRVAYGDLRQLRELLPPEVWRLREIFFHRDMQLELGGCQQPYPLGALPGTAPDGDPDRSLAGQEVGLRWAWNLEQRYRGGGQSGRFRLVDIPSELGGIEHYEGEWSYYPGRDGADYYFVNSGRLDTPSAVRHLAWRQLRRRPALEAAEAQDDVLVYLPALRTVRRAPASWIDGLYTPRFRAGRGTQLAEHLAQGWLGLSLRPGAYRWRLLEARDVLAPLDVRASPRAPGHYGESERSFGNERWDLRRAVVIQGALRRRERPYDFLTLYIDYETLHPLYVLRHRRGSKLVDVGILAHRHRVGPVTGEGERVGTLSPVAAVFHSSDGSGWRRESHDLALGRPDAATLERVLSQDALARGR